MAEPIRIVRIEGRQPSIGRLVEAANQEGLAFVAKTRTEWRNGTNRFDRAGEGFLVAETADGGIIGMCGLNVDPFLADPAVGRLRHLYVAPESRLVGVGRTLVAACLGLAATTFDRVRLRTYDPTATAFYRALGFDAVSEPDATQAISVTSHAR